MGIDPPRCAARRARLALAFGLSTAACAARAAHPETVTVPAAPVDRSSEIDRYLPFEADTVYSYETATDGGERGLLIAQISRPREGRVDLKMGNKTERLEMLPDGAAYVGGGYLLKAPVVAGATWKGRSGTVRVEAVDQSVTVPAGQFQGCVRTVEEAREPGSQTVVRSVMCPHVGLVSIDVEATSDAGDHRETAVLKSFGPRVDLGATETTTTTTTEDDAPPTHGP